MRLCIQWAAESLDLLLLEDDAVAGPGEEAGQLVELHLLPLVERMVMALGTADLDAEENA